MTHSMHLSKLISTRVAQAASIFVAPVLLLGAAAVQAQTIYRCPSINGITQYTNEKAEADRQGCVPMTGGNVTVINGTRVQTGADGKPAAEGKSGEGKEGKDGKEGKEAKPVRVANAPQAGSRIDGAEQRSRDSDSKAILESELRKAQARQAELLKEYNHGEPDKRGGEAQNHQKYLDRVAEMKATIARNDADIAGITRELGRTAPVQTRAQVPN